MGISCIFFNAIGQLIIIIILEGFIECKIDTNPVMCSSPRKDGPGRTGMGQYLKSTSQGMTKVGYTSLNK